MSHPEQAIVVRLSARSLDDIPLGIVRMSTDTRVTYANRAAREAAGPALVPGVSIFDLTLEDDSRQRLEQAIASRFAEEHGSDYELVLLRPDTGTSVHVMVSAVPEYDVEGRLAGSVGFVTNLSLNTATMRIHDAIERSNDWRELLTSVAGEVERVIAFHTFAVTIVSENRHHLRQFFERPDASDAVSPIKWWPMPEFVVKMLEELRPSGVSVEELFAKPEYKRLAETDPATRAWLARGFKHQLRCPVYRENRLAAVIMLNRIEDRPFTQQEVDTLTHLPIVEAVNMSLALDRKGELQFSLELIHSLGEVAESIPKIAETLVSQLQRNFGWEHVSLFHVDEDRAKLAMLYQKCIGTAHLREGYEQDLGDGLLGHVLRTRAAVNVGDVRQPPWRDMYIVGMENTRSELCMPIPGSKLRWILNVEASQTDAFADEEQRSVERLLTQAGLILDRAASIEIKNRILHYIDDAVIQTNKDGIIQEVNPAAEHLFLRSMSDLRGESLAMFIDTGDEPHEGEPSAAAAIVAAPKVAPVEVGLVRPDGARVPVLLSGASLPAELGGKVYFASDLTLQRRVERMDLLKQVFRQVASETRVPLALASTFLADTAREGADVRDLVNKAQKQIRKADLPLERVLRLASASEAEPLALSVVDLREALASLVSQLPNADASTVRVPPVEHPVLARAAWQELLFCLQSVLAFLVRQKAQTDVVDVKVGVSLGIAFLSMGLTSSETSAPSTTVIEGEHGDHLRDFALAEPVIEGLMQRMNGRYQVNRRGALRFRFALQPGEESDVATARA